MIPGGTPIRREEIGLDANVDVCLTQAGKAVLARFYEDGGEKGAMNTANSLHADEKREVYTFQLELLMKIFGSSLGEGKPMLFQGRALFVDL